MDFSHDVDVRDMRILSGRMNLGWQSVVRIYTLARARCRLWEAVAHRPSPSGAMTAKAHLGGDKDEELGFEMISEASARQGGADCAGHI